MRSKKIAQHGEKPPFMAHFYDATRSISHQTSQRVIPKQPSRSHDVWMIPQSLYEAILPEFIVFLQDGAPSRTLAGSPLPNRNFSGFIYGKYNELV